MTMAGPTSTSSSSAVSGPHFFAFDLLKVDGDDLRPLPLIQRKRPLKAIMPNVESRLRYVEHIEANGSQFYRLACEHDLEGIVAK